MAAFNLIPFRFFLLLLWNLFAMAAQGGDAPVKPVAEDDRPIHIPLRVTKIPSYGTYKPQIDIGIGNLKALPFVFDTGSSGLHVFANAKLEGPGSGVEFSQTPTSISYGNPARITYHGVICYARLHFGNFTTPVPVPMAYLTSASLPDKNPNGKLPDLRSNRADGIYGVLGMGLTGKMFGKDSVPNPFVTLPGRRGSIYSIILGQESGELVLGSPEPKDAFRFPLIPGTAEGVKWNKGYASLFVDQHPVGTNILISFDTGNGVPWIHNPHTSAIPQTNGLVKPSARIGFGPPGGANEAASMIAGTSFAEKIKVVDTPRGQSLINVGIQPFFNHIITYDNAQGVISVAAKK